MNFRDMNTETKDGRPPQPQMSGNPFLPLAGLARQQSVYSLTLDEFQNSLGGIGKDLGSMNMDELLKNIWTAEEAQAMASSTGIGMSEARGSGLGRQGSLTLPRTVSQKTVDEVWRDLLKETSGGAAEPANTSAVMPTQQRQPTLGEMTLEEFLVRAGVVREDANQSVKNVPMAGNNISSNTNNAGNNIFFGDFSGANSNCNMGLGLSFPSNVGNVGMTASQPLPNNSAAISAAGIPYASQVQLGNNMDLGNQQAVRGIGMAGISAPTMNNGMLSGAVVMGACGITAGTTGSPMNPLSSDGFGRNNGDLSSISPVPYTFNRGLGKKCSGVEKVVERRQRRMIKNRESAARSRARKQAYTMELEAEVAKLKEQNQELQKKQAEIIKIQKKQVLEKINQESKSKRLCLRRAQTGPWIRCTSFSFQDHR